MYRYLNETFWLGQKEKFAFEIHSDLDDPDRIE